MKAQSARAFAAGLRHAANGQAARWRECWCCKVIVQQGRAAVLAYAQATYRDEDTVYRMAQAARAVLALSVTLREMQFATPKIRAAVLAAFRQARRELPYTHFGVAARRLAQAETTLAIVADLETAAETGAGVRSYAGHTAPSHSIILPLWTAATIAEYLPRANGARFVVLEGAEWADVERVTVKAETKR